MPKTLTVLTPCFNEEANVRELFSESAPPSPPLATTNTNTSLSTTRQPTTP